MSHGKNQKFVRDRGQLEQWRLSAKLRACPHCGRQGTLNAHSRLTGYSEHSQARVLRGQRFYCSNRFARTGCGRTFSVLLSHFLAGFVVTASTLSSFLDTVLSGLCRKAAWQRVGSLCLRSGYRLFARLLQAQSHMRSHLHRRAPPQPSEADHPLAQLLSHMRQALPGQGCPLARFQSELQVPLLP